MDKARFMEIVLWLGHTSDEAEEMWADLMEILDDWSHECRWLRRCCTRKRYARGLEMRTLASRWKVGL